MKNADKTHCPRGHPYVEGNTIVYVRKSTGRPVRKCAICKREHENRAKYASSRSERDHTSRYRKYAARNPEKEAAKRKVYSALRSGRLTRPEACERCGMMHCRIEASHDDYSKPLDVTWLCVRCHRAKDTKYRITPGVPDHELQVVPGDAGADA